MYCAAHGALNTFLDADCRVCGVNGFFAVKCPKPVPMRKAMTFPVARMVEHNCLRVSVRRSKASAKLLEP